MNISRTLAALLLISASYGSLAECSINNKSSKQILDCIVAEADCKVDELAAKDFLVNLPARARRNLHDKPGAPNTDLLL